MNTTHRSIANSRLAILLLGLAATSGYAQTTTAPAEPNAKPEGDTYVLEKFVTTGTAIQRTDTEKVLPVTVFHTEDISARDSSTSMDLLASIPQITNIPNNETPVNAVAVRGGNANVALRGLPARNTLILLNGRRIAYQPYYTAQGAANVNVLPVSGLSQIEVLRDGASSLYGADAVAGVLNYITNTNLNGGTTSLRLFSPEHDGGRETNFNFSYGKTFMNGKARFVASGAYLNRDAIYLGERESSDSPDHRDQARSKPAGATDAAYTAYLGKYNGFSPTSPRTLPSFNIGTTTAPTNTNSYFMYFGTDGLPVIPTTTGSGVVPAAQYPNYQAGTTYIGQPFSSRGSLFSRFEYDIKDSLTAFVEVLGFAAHSQTGRQPVASTWADSFITIGKDNPYNPYGSAFVGAIDPSGTTITTGRALQINGVLVNDSGFERSVGEDAFYRALGGLKGKFSKTWNWESAVMVSGYRQTDVVTRAVRDSLIRSAALRTDALAWNPFGYTWKVVNGRVVLDKAYSTPPEVSNSFTQAAKAESHTKLMSWDFRANGEIVELWAGPILGAAGLEYRFEQNSLQKAPYVGINPPGGTNPDLNNNDIMVMSPKFDYKADRTLYAGYAETVVPLIAPKNNIAFTDSLNLDISVRYERYDDFGNATKPKIGLDWKVNKHLMFRTSYNEGFLAPDLATMNQPTSFTVASPPGSADNTYNLFFGSTPAVFFPATKTYTLANPDLKPEESKGITAGVIFDVPLVKGLSVSVDYFEIEQENLLIDSADAVVARYDYDQLLAYTQSQLAAGKSILSIDLGSKTLPTDTQFYAGSPFVLRAAPRPEQIAAFQAKYATLPQNQWVAPFGDYLGGITQKINTAGRNFTNGFDAQLDYDLPRTPFGQFRFTTNWTRFLNKFQKVSPTSPKNDDIRSWNLPEWRGTALLQWRKNQWSGSLQAVYQSQIRTGATFTAGQYADLGSPSWISAITNNNATTYYEKGYDSLQINLGVGYKFASDNTWLKGTSVRLGVNNILDEDPPLTAVTGTGYSGATGSALWIGRAYSLTFTREF